MIPLLERDLEHIDQHVGSRWEAFRGRDILVTGGTGFFGKWILESWLWANERHHLDAKAWVISRNPDSFVAQMPHLAHRCIAYVRGDVQTFQLPQGLQLSHVI